ncbi:MAG: metallophosphoesterase family protein [Candidatus Buchananbacteria bacterium]|nr:metallophosphoesterase family protein [Candidatus Buchananbacteria bacterium]
MIAIISDTHDNLATLELALKWINQQQTGAVIHCGDICALDTLQYITDNFPGTIHAVTGNGDDRDAFESEFDQHKRVTIHGNVGALEMNDQRMAFCHFPNQAKALAHTGKFNLVFHGHTHQPWEERIGECRVINPGTLAGLFQMATFALYDPVTNALQLKIVSEL